MINGRHVLSGFQSEWFLNGRIKLRQLALVRMLGETGNLRRAAAAMHVAQPAATKLLADLEAVLGVSLFERSRGGMAPTIYGEALIRHARSLLAGLDVARDEIKRLVDGASGSVTVGTLVSTAPVLLPRSIARLKSQRPGVMVSVTEGTHDLLIAALLRGDLDVTLGRVTGEAGSGGLNFEVLYEEDFCVVCGTAHPLARSRRLRFADLVDQPWILPPAGLPIRQRLDALFAAATGRVPDDVTESVSLLTNQTLLQEAPFLGVLPEAVALHYRKLDLLRILPVPLEGLRPPVAVITRKDAPLSPAAAGLIDTLRTAARELRAARRK